MKTHTVALLLMATMTAAAGEPPAPRNNEIVELLTLLGASSCQFYRNGSWHDAHEAQAHLQRKYDYLRKRGWADSAEQFIANGATKSSISGRPYQVKCGDAAAVPSAQWLAGQLAQLRSKSQR